ncbi:hypothetical protein D3C81_2260500 [compost metagenome]
MLYKDILLYISDNDNCSDEEYLKFKVNYDAIQEEYFQERASTNKKDPEPEEMDE